MNGHPFCQLTFRQGAMHWSNGFILCSTAQYMYESGQPGANQLTVTD